MKRVLITFAFLSLFSLGFYAQDFCGTPTVTNLDNVRKLTTPQKRTANSYYILRIYFHVIRSSSGTGGVTTSNVTSAYSRLYNDYNSHGIYFYWDGTIDYIDNNYYYNNNPEACTSIFSVNNHVNGIDIYLFPANPNYNYSSVGMANGVGMSSEFYVVGNISGTPVCTISTISHEMGHVLNLWHTHHGTFNEGGNDNPCAELVNGSNSSTCGDYVEDTPADPNLSEKVNINCVYTGTATDANNQEYTPDVTLIMSYAKKSCRTRFSTKQGERMRESIANLSYLIQTQCTLSVSGSSLICSTESFTIQNLPSGATVQWSASNSKLSLVSGQGTGTATFQKVSNGACTITAQVTIGTTTLSFTKDVWAGTPTAPTVTGWPHTNLFMENTQYNFGANGNSLAQILEYQWTVIKGATLISGGNSSSATFLMDSAGPVSIRVRARNACGWGPYTNKSGTITDDNGQIPINSPGNNILTIPLSDDGEYEIQLWNTNRMIRSTKTTKSSYDVDLSNLPSDLYIIKVLKDGQNFNQMKVKKQN